MIVNNDAVNDDFGGIFDSLKNLIPSKTIVGKLVRGDVGGAATGAVNLVASAANPPKAVSPTKTTAALAQKGLFSPGGFVEQNQTLLILAAVGLGVAFVAMRKRKGRR